MTSLAVIDTSALLALIQQEKGEEVMRPLIGRLLMSTVNVAETLGVLQRTQIFLPQSVSLVSDLLHALIPFEITQAKIVAELELTTKSKGLSLGDRACLALGILKQVPIYTADKVWTELKIEGADIRLIR